MKTWRMILLCLGAASVLAGIPDALRVLGAENATQHYRPPKRVYVDLTREYYEALHGPAERDDKVYSNDMSDEYLRQIAVSSAFTVRTNLQIIKQQERIIQLLQSIRDKEK